MQPVLKNTLITTVHIKYVHQDKMAIASGTRNWKQDLMYKKDWHTCPYMAEGGN